MDINIFAAYFLVLCCHYNRDQGLDQGRLVLENLVTGNNNIWTAATSHARGQEKEGFHKKGGMIPPAYRCPEVKQWRVDTTPLNLSHVKGVSGNFYKISPHEVKTDKGGVRGDFGIHLDANVPGSLGCPVMNKKNFRDFENTMTRLRSEGVKSIPLIVAYS